MRFLGANLSHRKKNKQKTPQEKLQREGGRQVGRNREEMLLAIILSSVGIV